MKKRTILFAILLCLSFNVFAQKKKKKDNKPEYTPASMWEVGAHGGYLFVAGDIAQQPGFGFGFHIRKATDYVFSIRADLLAGQMNGESLNPTRNFTTNYYSGTLLGVIAINNFKWDTKVRKLSLYALVGGGMNNFTTEITNELVGRLPVEVDGMINPHVTAGAGFSYRVSKRFNVGIEHQASILFGRRSDFLDGIEDDGTGNRTPFRDILNYTSLRLNLNIGDDSKKEEPLYWLNPLDVVIDDIQDLKKKNKEVAIEDTDGDGVIDAIDQEPNTPPDARVDTKGRTLDSDRDGIADHLDQQPYYTPRPGEEVNSEGVVENPIAYGGGGGVTEERVKELIDEALSDFQVNQSTTTVADWFLPMLHFGAGSSTIKYSDYGTLAGIARMLNSNSSLRLVVTGFTDQTASETVNDQLSYDRANSVIEHLVEKHNVDRNRLVLHWKGESESLVSTTSSSYMNRRVEFRVARNEMEMPAPAAVNTKPEKKPTGY